jgi:hypothetical protein
MIREPSDSDRDSAATTAELDDIARKTPRLFIHEPGWKVGQKTDASREFCYMIAPGDTWHHRLRNGEIIVSRAEEKLCLRCAARRGLLSFEAKNLRTPIAVENVPYDENASDQAFELASIEDPVAPPKFREFL